jgi:hypothetical protein
MNRLRSFFPEGETDILSRLPGEKSEKRTSDQTLPSENSQSTVKRAEDESSSLRELVSVFAFFPARTGADGYRKTRRKQRGVVLYILIFRTLSNSSCSSCAIEAISCPTRETSSIESL